MRDKFIQMRPLLKDRNVISDCETQIKEYQKYIDYFTEEKHRLEAKESNNDENDDKTSPTIQSRPPVASSSEHPPRSSSMATNATPPTAVVPVVPPKNDKTKYSNLGNCHSIILSYSK
jgi:hypothetical protein